MSISYEGIGAWCATFAAGTGAEEGKVVKVSANGTVSKCAANAGFCGVVAAMGRDGRKRRCERCDQRRTQLPCRRGRYDRQDHDHHALRGGEK